MKSLVWICSVWLLATSTAWAQDLLCDERFVMLSGAEILIAPTGSDDTDNVQCALDEAVRLGVQKVKLEPANYFIKSVEVDRFEGQFEGRSTATTVLNVADRSLTCSENEIDSVLRFNLGAPSVKFMTIKTGRPCSVNSEGGYFAVYFSNNPANCTQRTFFGTVDRVAFEATAQQREQGIAVAGMADFTCPSNLPANGTLKLNRSSVKNYTGGIATIMGAGSQVDINFNEFSQVDTAVGIIDANQNTTITQNTFNFSDVVAPFDAGAAIDVVAADPDGPTTNRTVIHKNTFNDGGANQINTAINLANFEKRPDHSVVISQNTFNLASKNNSAGINAYDIDRGSIQGNTFKGNASVAIALYREYFIPNVVEWSIVGNSFTGLNAVVDISLSNGTSNNVVGSQGASVDSPAGNDIGSGNQILAVSDAVTPENAAAESKALAAVLDSTTALMMNRLTPARSLPTRQ